MFPERVPLDNEAINRLVGLYEASYKKIVSGVLEASDFGRVNRASIAREIEKELTRLGVDTAKWVEAEIPKQYRAGIKEAMKQLEVVGAKVSVKGGFTKIDRRAIEVLVGDVQRSFGDSLSAVNRSARQIFSRAAREEIKAQIATGRITGEARKEIANRIKDVIREKGVSALNDRGGKSWSLDRYADMLTRTKMVEARNTGLGNRMLENGYDLVEVSSHGADDVCGDWEGKVLSLTGATDGYETLADAEADGLFHPNCKHAINAVHTDLASKTEAYDTESGDYE